MSDDWDLVDSLNALSNFVSEHEDTIRSLTGQRGIADEVERIKEIHDTGDEIRVLVEVPEDISHAMVYDRDGVVTIEVGGDKYRFEIEDELNTEEAEASINNGVFEAVIPKRSD